MNLSEFSVRHPVSILMLFLAIFLIGSLSISKLSVDMLPEMEPPMITVLTVWPGSNASDVESEVTTVVEDQLSTVNGLDTLFSKSMDNISVVSCKFEWGSDLDVATNDIRDALELGRRLLPSDIDEPTIYKMSTSAIPILIITAVAKESWPSLRVILKKKVIDEIKRVPGVGAVMVEGGLKRRINIYFDSKKLEAYHISIPIINKILASENINLPAGSIKSGKMEYFIRIPAKYRSVEEIQDTVIGNFKERFIYLRDVAQVSDSYETPQINGLVSS